MSLLFRTSLVFFMFVTLAQSADIIWVHQMRGGGDGTAGPAPGEGSLEWEDDQWRVLIEGAGHSIIAHDRYDDSETISNDAYDARVEALNAADLVIFSRDSNSGDYNDPFEYDAWTSDFTTPMIIMSPYMLRNNRWDMVNNASIADALSPMLPTVPDHPIFEGIELDQFGEIEFWSPLGDEDHIDLVGTDDFGNAEVLAEETDTGFPWIAYWEGDPPGGDFYDGSTTFVGGPRLFLSAGSDDDPNTWGEKNITPAGDQIVLNAITFLTGDAGTPPDTCVPGIGDFDGDGNVAFTDFLILSANFGQEGTAATGDADCNGSVEFSDFLILSSNFGATAGAASVPEPNSSLLLVIGVAMIGYLRRRRAN